jgi:hypothetical protein
MFHRDLETPPANATGSLPLLSVGRFLLLVEIYLLIATVMALTSDALIAPPMLIFAVLHHWLAVATFAALVCGLEFLWRRNWVTGAVLVIAVVLAVGGERLLMES